MLDIPYIKQPDPKSCALACYTMVAKHFFPETSFEEIAKISDWKKNYVVWSFKFWLWIMDKGVTIKEYDSIDYELWAEKGIDGLRESVSEKEFDYYLQNTKDLGVFTPDILKVINHQNFNFFNQKPIFSDLEESIKNNKVCEVVLESRSLRGLEGFSLHRVVVLDVTEDDVIFHDPAYKAYSKIDKESFEKAWLNAVAEPELCIYDNTS